jgi:hypothetical protein
MLNYVVGWTGVQKVDFFGHSMGSTAFFGALISFIAYAQSLTTLLDLLQ